MTGKREVERMLESAEEDDAGELDDVEKWRAFISGEHPRTGEPLSDERRVEFQRALAEFADQDPREDET